MGYRLDIIEKTNGKRIEYYGTKHYGYKFYFASDAIEQGYKSVIYLQEIGKINLEEYDMYWDYGVDNQMVLTPSEFRTWIELYFSELLLGGMEYFNNNKELQALYNSNYSKIISWC